MTDSILHQAMKSRLNDSVCEYFEDNHEYFIQDLIDILKEEENYYNEHAQRRKGVRELFEMIAVVKDLPQDLKDKVWSPLYEIASEKEEVEND